MKSKIVVVKDPDTGDVFEMSRRLFEHPVFNPGGRLIEVDKRSGCVPCGTAPIEEPEAEDAPEDIDLDEEDYEDED